MKAETSEADYLLRRADLGTFCPIKVSVRRRVDLGTFRPIKLSVRRRVDLGTFSPIKNYVSFSPLFYSYIGWNSICWF